MSTEQPDLVFTARARWALTLVAAGAAVAVVTTAALVAASGLIQDARAEHIAAHAVGAAPFLVAAALLARRARALGPPEYRRFWRLWGLACGLGVGASLAGTASVALHVEAFLGVGLVLMVAGIPAWVVAIVLMVRANSGRRSVAVDLVNAATALVVLSAPAVLAGAEPVSRTDQLAVAAPFAVCVVLIPAHLYLSFVNLSRIPAGERAAQGIGTALGTAFAANATLQLGHVVGGVEAPLAVFVAVHATNMALVMALPLWAHRHHTSRLARLPPEHQARHGDPLPYVTAVVLPALAVYVALTGQDRPWQVPYLVGVLLAVVLLHAARHTTMAREAHRLSADVARLSEERRRLVASMLRALEDDRRRTATELHTQAVVSLASLGSIVQTASAGLPSGSAVAVRQTIAHLQADLGDRAEELRRLMLAMRPPALDAPPGGGRVPEPGPRTDEAPLAAALLAYASDLDPAGSGPAVRVAVDPHLRLDWAAMTVVYRIAQEAVLNAARHGHARAVDVRVVPHDQGMAVEVGDDGVGFDPERVAGGTGLATMEHFARLGRGDLSVASSPGGGTRIRAVLGTRHDPPASRPGPAAPDPPTPGRRHLRSVPDTPKTNPTPKTKLRG